MADGSPHGSPYPSAIVTVVLSADLAARASSSGNAGAGVLLACVSGGLATACLHVNNHQLLSVLCAEDGPVETLQVLVLVLFIVLPLLVSFHEDLRDRFRIDGLPAYPTFASSVPLTALAIMAVPRLIWPPSPEFGPLIFNFDEVGELFLAVIFLILGLRHLMAHSRGSLTDITE